jgi:hypothetical protein
MDEEADRIVRAKAAQSQAAQAAAEAAAEELRRGREVQARSHLLTQADHSIREILEHQRAHTYGEAEEVAFTQEVRRGWRGRLRPVRATMAGWHMGTFHETVSYYGDDIKLTWHAYLLRDRRIVLSGGLLGADGVPTTLDALPHDRLPRVADFLESFRDHLLAATSDRPAAEPTSKPS